MREVPEHVVDSVLDGGTAAFVTATGDVVRYDFATGSSRSSKPAGLATGGLTFTSLHGAQLAQSDGQGAVRLFDLDAGTTRELARFGDACFAMVFSDDGQWLAAASRDGNVRVIEVRSGQVRASLQLHTIVWGLAFSHDDRMLGAAGSDGVARVVELANGRVYELVGHVGTVAGIDFGPTVITSGTDGTVRSWDLESGHGVVIHREPFPVTSVQFVQGTSLVMERGYDADVIRIWDTRVLPPSADLVPWLGRVTEASVDARGDVSDPL